MEELSLYFHIPYCRNKCIYCDFYSGGVRIADWKRLTMAFLNELNDRKMEWEGKRIVSIYLGGGTPSLMPAEMMSQLLGKVRHLIGDENIMPDCEITLEVNPEDVNDVSVDEWKRGGVNRVSVGVQTFNDKGLKSIGRRHTGESAEIALIQLMSHFSNVSADLIFGLPGQSLEDLNMDIERILKLKPKHISIYSLMYEEGTAITYLRDAGRISPVDDEVATEMFKIIINRLNQAGYNRYEISNYSIAGFESRHNRGYWTGRRYIGIGPSAHSFDGDSKRSSNPADIMGYLNRFAPKESEDTESHYQAAQEELTQMQKIEEMIMLSLRMKEGIDLNQFLRQYGLKEQHNLMKRAQKSIRQGNLICDIEKGRLYLSDSGVLISDSIILDLIP